MKIIDAIKADAVLLKERFYRLFTRVNLDDVKVLAEGYDHSVDMVWAAAVLQRYVGGLEPVIRLFMVSQLVVGLLALFGVFHPFMLFVNSTGVGFVLYIEYLYTRKGSSFLTHVEGLSRALCPDKNSESKYTSVQETLKDVE